MRGVPFPGRQADRRDPSGFELRAGWAELCCDRQLSQQDTGALGTGSAQCQEM